MTKASEPGNARASSLAARVRFVIVTALEKEYVAMKAMLDEPVPFNTGGRGATHDYLLGEIPAKGGGGHAVAVVLADQGNPNAAVHATSAVADFADVNAVIMVGIAGGVPNATKAEDHVRLGDIVVSGKGGVAKYDFVKEHRDRIEAQHSPRPPSSLLLAAARRLAASALEGTRPWEDHVERAAHLAAARPSAEADRLADAGDPSIWLTHPEDPARRAGAPRVFHGIIGAADRLQRNAVQRDRLRDDYGVRAIEMEGAGIAEAAWLLGCAFFIVRGTCDYCDANKNDIWQPYAAVIAAAYVRALLEETATIEPDVSSRTSRPSPLDDDPTAAGGVDAPAREQLSRRQSGRLRAVMNDADPIIEAEHNAHLDGARELLKKGHARLARDDLEALKTRIWSAASPTVRARVLALIGHAEFDLGHFDVAGKSLVAALEAAPSDPKAQANGALGHALLGNVTAAKDWATRALVADPTSMTARQVLIHHDDREDAAIVAEHEAVVGRRSEIYFALGQRAGRANDPARAAEWFRRAAEIDSSDADVLASAGHSILGIVLERLDEASGSEEFAAEDRERLREAADLLQRAWNALKDDEVRAARVHWLIGLGNAHRLLAERGAAVAAAEEALRFDRDARNTIQFRAALAADEGDYRRVVALLEGKTGDAPEAIGLLAAAKSNLGEHEAATDLWKRLLECELSDAAGDQAERNLVLTLLAAGREADARAAVAALLEKESSLSRELLASEVGVRSGDAVLRDERLQKALALATRETPHRLLIHLGDALLNADRPAEAAGIYELCMVPERSDRDAHRLLTALYRSGRFASALETCRRITQTRGPDRRCAEVESVIHEQLGDLPRAREICETYLKSNSSDSALLLRLAAISARAGDKASVGPLLDRVSTDDALEDVQRGALFAELLVFAGRTAQALDVLYRVRRRHIDDPRAHLLYVSRHLVLGRDEKQPSVIGADVAVRFSGSDAPKNCLLLTSATDADLAQGEIPLTHAIAKAAVGKRVGDVVTFEGAPHRKWTVTELQSKYVFAHQQTLTEFGSRFPDDASLQQHEVPEDINEFIATLKERLSEGAPRWDKVLEAYGTTSVTVGAIANALKKSPHESIGIVLASRHGLIAAANTVEEKSAASTALERGDATLVLDFTALVILDAVDMLVPATAGRTIAVAQTTVDALRQEVARWRDVPEDGFMSLGLQHGEVLKQVFSGADAARNRDRLERLIAWISEHCRVEPVSAASIEKHADKHELGDLIGESSSDSLHLASEPGRLLVSDDLKLRFIGRQLFAVEGVASVHLIHAQRAAGRLDPQTAATALTKLVVANYRHVGVDATMLEAAARIEQWRPVGSFIRVAETLKGPDAQIESAIVVVAEFFRIAWFALVLPQQRDALVMAVMDALVTGRNRRETLAVVRKAVVAKFVLLPVAAEDFERVLKVWARMHLL